MGSSKTANAIMVHYNYQERGQKALMFKPKLDKRDGEKVRGYRAANLRCDCDFIENIGDYNLTEYACA